MMALVNIPLAIWRWVIARLWPEWLALTPLVTLWPALVGVIFGRVSKDTTQ